MAPITTPETTIVDGTLLLAMPLSVGPIGSTHGIPAAFITAFWTTPEL